MVYTREQVIKRALNNIRSANRRLSTINNELAKLQSQVIDAKHSEHREFYECKNAPRMKVWIEEQDRILEDRRKMISILKVLHAGK